MKELKKRWSMLASKDRYRLMVIGLAVIISVYTFVIYPRTSKSLLDSENMIKRRLDRIEKRTQIKKQADGDLFGLTRQLSLVEKDLEVLRARLAQNMEGFAPLDSSSVQQRLRLEISTLARRSGLHVRQAARVGSQVSGQNVSGKTSRPPDISNRNTYGRPLYEINAETNYWSLVRFLEDLKQLTYHVSVVNIEAKAMEGAGNSGGNELPPLPSGRLNVRMVLTL
ncbi:MAG: hypothetical protein G3M70_11605 [Candidatus Nitronauta litoralis]|uniref:Uncharacterized protein n=1 Tax=Candidatus Nitronauta litoralis TaxID=2705533 RepID=A0A7T0G0F3_9BACT|nr:MAG: hypothetical protein G3M70_11605 [Candidatus Nitronauta litoralis]